MDLNSLPVFGLLREKMAWLHNRQTVIAQNLANADTPGYRAKRVNEPDFSAYIGALGEKLAVEKTNEKHLSGRRALGGISAQEAAIHGRDQLSPDGNSVDIPEETLKMADTQMQYNMATNLYRKQVQLLRTALGRQGN